jgi:hypothetical protein
VTGLPLRWCPRCNTRLRIPIGADCTVCGLPGPVFGVVERMRTEYVEAVTELTTAHRAAIEAVVRNA